MTTTPDNEPLGDQDDLESQDDDTTPVDIDDDEAQDYEPVALGEE